MLDSPDEATCDDGESAWFLHAIYYINSGPSQTPFTSLGTLWSRSRGGELGALLIMTSISCRCMWHSAEEVEIYSRWLCIFWWRFQPANIWTPAIQIQCWANHQDSTWTRRNQCHVKPTAVSRSASYVVAVRSLTPTDVQGVSGRRQLHKSWEMLWRCLWNQCGAPVCLHCMHPSNADFKRLICFLSGEVCVLCVMGGSGVASSMS